MTFFFHKNGDDNLKANIKSYLTYVSKKSEKQIKLLYISFINEETRKGYFNKIINQTLAFNHLGLDTYMTARNNDSFWVSKVEDTGVVEVKKIFIATDGTGIRRYLRYINAIISFFDFCYECADNIKPDIIYIRRIRPITPMLINFIKNMRKRGLIVLYEYPTYPWESELLISKYYLSYIIDKLQYKLLLKSINAMVCMGHCKDKTCDVVETMNGINFIGHDKNLNYRLYMPKRDKAIVLNIIIVANYSAVHGIEKLLKGMASYYRMNGTADIRLMIVGPESGFVKLKEYINKIKMKDHVHFYGYNTGAALDKIYEAADIGLDAIALEIRGEECVCGSLKSREYISKGLPFICSDLLDIVYNGKANSRFMFISSHKENEVDVNSLIDWYRNLEISSDEIIEFGKDNLTWEKTMEPVLNYCQSLN